MNTKEICIFEGQERDCHEWYVNTKGGCYCRHCGLNMTMKGAAVKTTGDAQSSKEWLYAINNDVTVAKALQNDRCQPLENIICQLVRDKEQYLKRVIQLESIAPRKITLPDGKVMVWHCPDEYVPNFYEHHTRD